MNTRIKELRKALGLNQTEFGKRIGVKQGSVASYETGVRTPLESVLLSICKEFNVNEAWLKTGEGNMFVELPPEDEFAIYISELLEDGIDNPLYKLIKEIMHTYRELSPKSQEVLREASAKLFKNMQKEED